MVIRHKHTSNKGHFFIGEEDNLLAELVYNMPSPGKLVIEHTEVSEALRGQQTGYKLVDAVADFARENALKIVPLCPFANAVFKKNPEYGDLLFS